MAQKRLEQFNCSWARAADAIGDKWSIMIIRTAFLGVRTFSAFVKSIGVSKSILSQRLEHLQKHGIIRKRPVGVGSSRLEYDLTDKGLALFPIIVALGQWGDEWIFGEGREPLILVDRDNRKPIERMNVVGSDGRKLGLRDVTFVAGPGASDNTRRIAEEIERTISGSD